MWLTLALAAAASELVAYLPAGAPFPGDESEVVVEWPPAVAGAVATVGAGELLGPATVDAAGRTHLRWVAPARPGPVQLTVASATTDLFVRARPVAAMAPQDARDAVAWADTVELIFASTRPPTTDQVLVVSSEGQVRSVKIVPGGLSVTVAPGPERVARVLAVGVLDLRTPGQVPAFATVRLRAHHGGQVSAEPGSRLSIRIGGRGYGPWVADQAGTAAVSFDALPGESNYELTVADDLGNTQTVINPVPTLARPAFVGLPRANFDRPGAWLAAWDARGQPMGGAPPSCRLGPLREPARAWAKGQWSWSAPPGSSQDQVAVCTLSEATTTVRVASAVPTPARLALRVYPESVSVDFPLAEVQAWLVDERDQRLAPDGIVLNATAGRLTTVAANDTVRADYDGSLAAPSGGDDIRATWRRPAGSGPAARIELCAGIESGAKTAVVRVLDAVGGPLSEVPVELRSRGLDGGPARAFAILSDARGYARFPIGDEALHLGASSGSAAGEMLVARDLDVTSECLARADSHGADLVARVRLPISTGRVRQVSIETEPRTLRLDPGATALLRVRLLDGAGGVVRDEPVSLAVSEGVLTAPVADADGTITARFTPGPATVGRTVAITASAGESRVATTLDLVPREVHGGVSLSAGYLTGFGVVESPTGTIAVEHRLPVAGLSIRLGVMAYGLDQDIHDELSGEIIRVRGVFFPLEGGVSYVQRGARWSLGAGIGLVVVPYGLAADYEAGQAAGGPGLSAPGVVARALGAYRFGQAEAVVEAGYLLYTLPDGLVGISGNAGGLTGSLGYRLLY